MKITRLKVLLAILCVSICLLLLSLCGVLGRGRADEARWNYDAYVGCLEADLFIYIRSATLLTQSGDISLEPKSPSFAEPPSLGMRAVTYQLSKKAVLHVCNLGAPSPGLGLYSENLASVYYGIESSEIDLVVESRKDAPLHPSRLEIIKDGPVNFNWHLTFDLDSIFGKKAVILNNYRHVTLKAQLPKVNEELSKKDLTAQLFLPEMALLDVPGRLRLDLVLGARLYDRAPSCRGEW